MAKFLQVYCHDHNHQGVQTYRQTLCYKDQKLETIEVVLCPACFDIFLYTYQRLQECPHQEKPRCRKCPHPCYEKNVWRKMAKVMMYSGMRLGLLKIKNKMSRKAKNLN